VVARPCDEVPPPQLLHRLGADAPRRFQRIGATLPRPFAPTAFLCSQETPGATILKALDQAAAWRDAERCIVSGFHSPLERQCLDLLLRGRQQVIMVAARGMGALRLPANQRQALETGRLTILSPFGGAETRTTAALAMQRNRVVAALADHVVFGFVRPGGSLAALRAEVESWGTPVTVLQRG
jgi:hypothetical protein